MKILKIDDVIYVKKWFKLYYIAQHEGFLVMLPVKKVKLK